MCLRFADSPLGFFEFKTEGPWLGQSRGRGVDRPKPARSGPGSEGEVREKKEEVLVNLLVVFLGLGVAGLEVPPAEQLLQRRRLAAEAVFRWGRSGMEWPGSFTST